MPQQILWLEEIDRTRTDQVGGKAANLGELKRRGLPVPDGFVLTADVYSRAMERDAVKGLVQAQLAGLDWSSHDQVERASLEIRRAVPSVSLPLEAELAQAHARLLAAQPEWKWVAVRSSGTAEDLPQASFAGQHGTYYYVGRNQLPRQIHNCWASLWSPQALLYRHTQQIDHLAVAIAVVVQLLVPAEVSGVAFTANPVTGQAGEMIVESSWGLGAALVDGKVTPDRFVVDKRTGKAKQRRLAEKQFMVPAPDGEVPAHRLQEVPWPKRLAWTLDDGSLQKVSEQAARVEQHYGAPQDIEWAMVRDQFYLLQARPITTLATTEMRKPLGGAVWVHAKPISENFTDPVSPMTQSVLEPPGLSLLGAFHYGRLYANLTLLKRLFFPRRATWEELARVFEGNPTDTRPKAKLSRWKLLLWSPVLALEGLVSGVALLLLWRLPDDALDSCRARLEAIEQDPKFGPARARRLLLRPAMNNPIIVNVFSAFTSMALHALLHRLLRRWAPALNPGTLALAATSDRGVLSAETGKRIWELARAADMSPALRQVLLDTPEALVEERLETTEVGRAFRRKVDEFLAFHGHRGFKEVELKSKRWVEQPAAVYAMIRNHLLQPIDLEAQEQRNARARVEAIDEVTRQLKGHPWRQRLVRWLIERTAYFSKLRENSRFYWIMSSFTIRKKLLERERDWRRRGWLKCEDDIFFLRREELSKVESGELRGEDLESLIANRRRQYATEMKLSPPRLLGVEVGEESAGRVLEGVSASPGVHSGRARIILNPAVNCRLERGDVLVAPYTDPAWTPLFLQAGALVVEVGSFLSHAGTVAREYGLPAVVDVRDCTALIGDGQYVTVDADRGLVTLDESSDSAGTP